MRGSAIPGNVANLREQFHRERPVRVEVIAGDLDVDRRRRAEVENLADNIRRQEREGRSREGLRKLLAQGLHIGVGRGRSLVQTNKHIGVEDADRSRVRVRQVDAADGRPMLFTMLVTRSGGMIERIFCSTWSVNRVVSSIRVPVGALRWILIAPESIEGKKSCPRNGASPGTAGQRARSRRRRPSDVEATIPRVRDSPA